KGDPMDFSAGGKPNEAIITVSFIDYEFRDNVNTSEIMQKLSQQIMGQYPGVELELSKDEGGPPTGKAVNLEIIGQDFDQLVYLADTIKTYLETQNIDGVEGLKMNISTQKPELLVHIDRDKAQRYGLSTQTIAYTIRQSLFGDEVSDFKVGEEEYPIMVRLKDEYRYNLAAMRNLKIPVFGDGPPQYIPLSAVADFEYSTTFSSVRRKNLDRVITLYSNVIEGYNANTINMQLEGFMEAFEMPPGYRYEFTGEQQEQEESSDFLGQAMLIALALIMLILVTQFNSVIKPLIILSSVLFSTIGVFGGLWTFKMDFIIIMTGIGIISLAGIVVNNAIVLVDYIELLKVRKRKELGLPEGAFLPVAAATECIVTAGKIRLRPVLLTAITTILGLLPMAVGLNFDFRGLLQNYDPNIYFGGDMAMYWGSMSWTVIFGLTFSTFLTLIIVPVMYRITVILQKKIMNVFGQYKPVPQNGNGE
ncbi:MAG: efflux RND transporter permease subunit, partial [Bacteroidota bacterium]